LSGLPAGVANAEMTSLVNTGNLTFDANKVGSSALYFGLFGATMGGVGHGLSEGAKWLTQDGSGKSSEAYARAMPDEARPDTRVNPEAPKGKFNIPETGNIELGKMMRETPFEDQIQLVQEVLASRPKVPAGSWMRLIAAEDMPQFLRAMDQMYPD